jgi:hypothetical protein
MTHEELETMKQNAPGNRADTLNAAFDATSIKFHDRAQTLATFLNNGEREITYDESGQPFAKYDSEILPLADALKRFAYDDKLGLCDRRTLPREGVTPSRPGIASKADFATLREKLDWLAVNGDEAYALLPLTPPVSGEVLTREDYYRLPRSQKTELAAKHGPDFLSTLPSKQDPNRTAGSYINHQALDRLKKINPSRN